jgi:hypothetical protein
MSTRMLGPIAALTIALAACSSGSAATTAPTTAPSQTTSISTPSATPSPVQTVGPSPSLPILPTGAVVPPGTYATRLQPALTLTLDRPAESNEDIPAWIDLVFEGDPNFEFGASRIDKVFDPKHPNHLIDPPHDLAAWIAKLPGLTLVAPAKAVQIGGLDATQLDVRTGDKDVRIAPIPGVDDPPQGVPSNGLSRLIVVLVGGHQIVFGMGVQDSDDAHFKASMELLQPMINSIVWH